MKIKAGVWQMLEEVERLNLIIFHYEHNRVGELLKMRKNGITKRRSGQERRFKKEI